VPRRARERRMTGGTITLQSSSCLSRRHPSPTGNEHM
jgi:hypothetical protein